MQRLARSNSLMACRCVWTNDRVDCVLMPLMRRIHSRFPFFSLFAFRCFSHPLRLALSERTSFCGDATSIHMAKQRTTGPSEEDKKAEEEDDNIVN